MLQAGYASLPESLLPRPLVYSAIHPTPNFGIQAFRTQMTAWSSPLLQIPVLQHIGFGGLMNEYSGSGLNQTPLETYSMLVRHISYKEGLHRPRTRSELAPDAGVGIVYDCSPSSANNPGLLLVLRVWFSDALRCPEFIVTVSWISISISSM